MLATVKTEVVVKSTNNTAELEVSLSVGDENTKNNKQRLENLSMLPYFYIIIYGVKN